MTQLNVQMSLTLADAASGPLRAFSEGLAALKAQTAGVSQRLEAIAVGITNVSKAAAGAQTIGALSGNLGALAAAMTGVRTASTGVAGAIGNVGRRASTAGVGTYALEQAMGALGGTLSGIVARLTATAAGLGAIGTEARAAGAGVRAGTAQMEGGLVGANTRATALGSTLKGLAALWGAVKIEGFLKSGIKEAGEFSVQNAQLRSLNLGAEKTAEIMGKAWDDSRALKFVNVLEAMKARMAAIGGLAQTMNQKTIDATLPAAMTLANNLQVTGGTGTMEDMVRNAYGMAEARGQTNDPEAIKKTFDFIQKSFTATGRKIEMRDWEAILRQYGQGANNISDEGLFNLIGVMDQIKISGGANSGGGAQRVGTSFKMLQAYGLGKPMNKQGAQLFADAGIINPASLVPSGDSTLQQNIKPGGFRDAALLASDPVGWVAKMTPLIMAYMAKNPARFYQGADVNSPEAQAVALQKFITSTGISVTAAQALGIAAQPKTAERIREQSHIAQNAFGVDQTKAELDKTLPQKLKDASAAFDNLKIVIAERLLPVLTPLIAKFGDFLGAVSKFGANHPVITSFIAWGAAIAAVALAIGGFAIMFGAALSLSGLMAPLAAGFAAARVGAAAMIGAFGRMVGIPALFSLAGAAVNTFAGLVMLGLKVAGGVVAAFFLGWEIGTFLANLNIGGQQVKDWGADLIEWVVNAFRKGWKTIGAIVSSIIPGARAAGNEGASGPRTGGASGSWDAPSTGGASGSWDAPTHSGSGRGSYAGYSAQADAASKGRNAKAGLFKPAFVPSGDDEEASPGGRVGGGGRSGRGGTGRGRSRSDELPLGALSSGQDQARNDFLRSEKGSYDTARADADAARESAALDQRAAEFRRNEAKASGERHQAELLHIQQEIAASAALLVATGRVTQAEVDAAIAKAQAASQYGYEHERIGALQDAERQREEEIRAAVQNATLSETAGDRQVFELRRALAAQLDELIAKQSELAGLSGDPKLVRAAGDQAAANDRQKLALPSDDVRMLGTIRTGFEGVVKAALQGKNGIEAFGQSLKSTLLDIISKRLGDALYDSIFGALFKGKGGAGGGDSGIFGFIGKLLGGFGGGGGGLSDAAVSSGASLSANGFTGFAVGIDQVPRDMWAPIHRDERVMTAADNGAYTSFIAAMKNGGAAGGAGTSVQLTVHPDAMRMTLGDWLHGEMARQMATR